MSSNNHLQTLQNAPWSDTERDPVAFEMELLRRLRAGWQPDQAFCSQLFERLRTEASAETLWFLIKAAELLPAKLIDVAALFTALQRMMESPQPVLRLGAYQSLARLYTLDLRFESRAKRVLAAQSKQENEPLRSRLKTLLHQC